MNTTPETQTLLQSLNKVIVLNIGSSITLIWVPSENEGLEGPGFVQAKMHHVVPPEIAQQ